jgi:biotin carboxyl carrier protein
VSSDAKPPDADPIGVLFKEVQHLHLRAGEPSSRKIAKETGAVSHNTVTNIIRRKPGKPVPSWVCFAAVVEHLGGDPEHFKELWVAARQAELAAAEATAGAALAKAALDAKQTLDQARSQAEQMLRDARAEADRIKAETQASAERRAGQLIEEARAQAQREARRLADQANAATDGKRGLAVTGPVAILLPELGKHITEATVVEWRVRVGDPLMVNEPLVDLVVDKANVEMAAPVSGVLERILVQDEETIEFGAQLAVVTPAESEAPAVPRYLPPEPWYEAG